MAGTRGRQKWTLQQEHPALRRGAYCQGEKTGHYPGSHCQKAGRTVKKVGVGSKKKRGPAREHITLGGLKKVDKANKRRIKSRMRKKL